MEQVSYKTRANSLCAQRGALCVNGSCSCAIHSTISGRSALTLVEMVMALAIMAIVFAAILPQFRAISNSWDSKQAGAESLQNGRVLIEHLNRNLIKAIRITAVSDSTETSGYITFEDNDGNTLRYDVNGTTSYVEFGVVGDLADLAGPVSQLQFTCYDACDFDTAITDCNYIRFVKVETTLTNPAALAQDKTFTASAYLRTNSNGLVAWWKLDETSGLTAADSSGNGNDGTLTNMAGDEWTTGAINGALGFDGFNDYVQTTSNESKTSRNFTWACWFKADTTIGAHHLVWQGKATENGWGAGASGYHEAHINVGAYDTDNILGCFYGTNEDAAEPAVIRIDTSFSDTTNWHHVAFVVTDADSSPSGELFLDGVSVGTDTGNQTGRTDWDTDLRIARPGANERYFDGTIDDVRIYNRALSADEIARLLTAGGVEFLTAWTSGLSHTAQAGSNRALIFTTHVEEDGTINLSSVTYGGQPMTKVIDQIVGSSGYYAYVAAYILDEAGIAAATGDTFVPNWSTTPDNVSYGSVFLQNVDQTDPIGASASNTTTSSNNLETTSLSTDDGDMVIVAATCGNTGNYTVNNGFMEAIEYDMASSTGVDGYKSATGVAETPSVTHSGANRQVIIGFVVQATEDQSGGISQTGGGGEEIRP